MAVIHTLIVDDEPLARRFLRCLLEDLDDIEIVGQCGDGREAVRLIEKLDPDLVFLDIQMPEVNGIQVVETLGVDRMPTVIFVTAYDQYALKAFDLSAVDYLLKPFNKERLSRALERAREQINGRNDGRIREQLLTLIRAYDQRYQSPHGLSGAATIERSDATLPYGSGLSKIPVRTGNRVVLVEVNSIDWIEAADDYVLMHCGDKQYLLADTMQNLADQLDGNRFVRIHRSTIVNLDSIKELRPNASGDYEVILNSGVQLRLSRRRKADLEKRLGRSL